MANAFEIARGVVGQTIDMDGQHGGQCMDLAVYVSLKLGGPWLTGDAISAHLTAGLSAYADVIPWDPNNLQVGDIINGTAGHQWGHIGVYGGGSATSARFIDQNFNWVQVVKEHTSYDIVSIIQPTHIIRFRNQTGYSPSGSGNSAGGTGGVDYAKNYELFEITCNEVNGVDASGKHLEKFFKCNKVTGLMKGDKLEYHRNDNTVGYIKATCVKNISKSDSTETKERYNTPTKVGVNSYQDYEDQTADGIEQVQRVYSLGDLISEGAIDYNGHTFGYLFSNNLPDGGQDIKGKGFNAHGFVIDGDGFVVLGSGVGGTLGAIYQTPFGHRGKTYYELQDQQGLILFIK